MTTMKETLKDLGLSYEEAGHGVQTAIKFRIDREGGPIGLTSFVGPKHLRTGLDLRASDALGLVSLLIDKGVFTKTEYEEYVRLAANDELARYEDETRKLYDLPGMNFR